MMQSVEVGKALVDLCRQGRFDEALTALYSPDIVSVEAAAFGDSPAETRGVTDVRRKNDAWSESNEILSVSVDGPYPHHDQFAVHFRFELRPRSGPKEGQRMLLEEIAVYTVADGKIVREQFFYDAG